LALSLLSTNRTRDHFEVRLFHLAIKLSPEDNK